MHCNNSPTVFSLANPDVQVHNSKTSECCGKWIEHGVHEVIEKV
jgi:hypothetical protein